MCKGNFLAMCRDNFHFYLMNSTDAKLQEQLTRSDQIAAMWSLRWDIMGSYGNCPTRCFKHPTGDELSTSQASENSAAGGTRDQWLRSFDHGVEVASHRCLSQAPRPKGGLERWEGQAWREIFEMSTWGRVANSSKFSKFQDHWWCLLGCSMRVQPSRLEWLGWWVGQSTAKLSIEA
jgi:hypothetical protein